MTENSAEREAEKILEAAYTEARAEECPQGEECPVHFRVDEEYIFERGEYARLITYSGEYVVITDDNHEYDNPALMLKVALGVIKYESQLPPRFETLILHVGSGAIGDITPDKAKSSVRYAVTHDNFEAVKDFHKVTVSGLTSGLIDVSKPVEGK